LDRATALVAEYRAGNEPRRAFCTARGIPMTTLDFYIRRESERARKAPVLLPVELTPAEPTPGVAIVLGNGRRLEVHSGFDEQALLRVLCLLERT